jgi:hypothetical protein
VPARAFAETSKAASHSAKNLEAFRFKCFSYVKVQSFNAASAFFT